ncbi:hypothetical protein Cob_v007237 [Colletotrichum orbiculare MAFF 240422]|uniref:Uncharacterized protein n=1 Tax=Colletotrichum orbiculare (strain 104-T / ATCC 96160 / CBS 514.97 / LARS 414 / MAFF 240422) TaxID=1213857 RepID=A0A484FRV2_COLOR|nr:hypothetical protein Cob_v007237 [Colletotrichum orbiculare MAFF 240422]
MTARPDVATLVAQMNEALASIHETIEGLSKSASESDTKLDELEKKRDSTLAELQAAYEQEQAELAAARQKELEEIAEQRRREDEEREARRRREDEELAALKAKQDEEKLQTFDATTHNVEDEMDNLMDGIEEEAAKNIAQGEAKLAELEEKRRELNRLIEEQMKSALPPVPTRKRARTIRKSGGALSGQPSPLPREEVPAPEDKAAEGDDSQPPIQEPVAEKSVEEAASNEETQSSEEAPPTAEPVATEAEDIMKEESGPDVPVAPEEANDDTIKEEPAAEENKAAVAAEVVAPQAPDNGQVEENAVVEEPTSDAAEAPAEEGPAVQEHVVAEQISAGDVSKTDDTVEHTVEESPEDEGTDPEVHINEVPASTQQQVSSEEDPQEDMASETEAPATKTELGVEEQPEATVEDPSEPTGDTRKATEEDGTTAREETTLEFSTRAVVEEPASEEPFPEDVAGPISPAAEEMAQEVDVEEHQAAQEIEAQHLPDVISKNADEEPHSAEQATLEKPHVHEESSEKEEVPEEEESPVQTETVKIEEQVAEATTIHDDVPDDAVQETRDAAGEEQPIPAENEPPRSREVDAEETPEAATTEPEHAQPDAASTTPSFVPEDGEPFREAVDEAPSGVDAEKDVQHAPQAEKPGHTEDSDSETRGEPHSHHESTLDEPTGTEAVSHEVDGTKDGQTDDAVEEAEAHETQAEVSEPPPNTQEEEEHLPTAASKDPEDGDSEPRDSAYLDREQVTRGVSDADEDDTTHGPSDAASDAPDAAAVSANLTQAVEAEEEEAATDPGATPSAFEEHRTLNVVEGLQEELKLEIDDGHGQGAEDAEDLVAEQPSVESDRCEHDDSSHMDDAANLGTVDAEEASKSQDEEPSALQEPASLEPDGDFKSMDTSTAQRDVENVAGEPLEPTDDDHHSTGAEEAIEKPVSLEIATTDASEADEARLSEPANLDEAPLARHDDKQHPHEMVPGDQDSGLLEAHPHPAIESHGCEVEEAAEEVKSPHVDREETFDQADVHEMIYAGDEHQDDPDSPPSGYASTGVKFVPSDFEHPASYDEPEELSVITEHTEPATSTTGDTSGVATKADEYFHTESSVTHQVYEAPEADLASSYVTEDSGMAADEGEMGEAQHQDDSFMPTASTLGQAEASFSSSKQVHFAEEEGEAEGEGDDDDDTESSPVLSVREESDADEPADDYANNPFTRPAGVAYNDETHHKTAAYNPFAQPGAEETSGTSPRSPYNPFTTRRVSNASDTSNNPFTRNTSSAADSFLRSASAQGHRAPSPAANNFIRSSSALGYESDGPSRDVPSNPFARSTSSADESFLPTASTLGQPQTGGVEDSFNNPFARNATTSVGDDVFAPPKVMDSTQNNPFARSASSERSFLPTASTLGHVDASHNNPFASSIGSAVGGPLDERMFDQYGQGNVGEMDDSDEEFEGFSPNTSGFVQASSPLSARYLAPTPLEPIQERYNSELEDMDSDSEEPESLTTSQQLPGPTQRAPPPMPSIAERHRREFDDSDEEEDHQSLDDFQPVHANPVLTSPQHRETQPSPSLRTHSSHGYHERHADDSSEEGDAFGLEGHGSSVPPSTTPPVPPRSQARHSQQQFEDSSDEEQEGWDSAFTPAQPAIVPTIQFDGASPPPSPPRVSSSLSQSRYQEEDSEEEDHDVLSSQAAQPFAMATSGYGTTPSPPPPPPPRAPSSQGFHHQDQADSRLLPLPLPSRRASSSQGQYRKEIEDSDDKGQDDWEPDAARLGQTHNLSTSQYGTTPPPPPPPPPRAPSAQDRHGHELDDDSDSEDNEEEWIANTYGQTTDVIVSVDNQMVASSPMTASPMENNPMRAASPFVTSPTLNNPMGARSSPVAVSPMTMGSPGPMTPTTLVTPLSPMVQFQPTEPLPMASVPASSQELQSHPREEDGVESDDSWENINQRGETDDTTAQPTTPGFVAPMPQLRVDNYEQQWPNASNDQISTASTYLTPAGPGDFTDTESQEYATPLASAGFSASSRDTPAAMDSPRTLQTADVKEHRVDRSDAQEAALSPSHPEDSDDDGDVVPAQAPAFLTQFGATQPPQHLQDDEPALEQVIDSFQGDSDEEDDDGPRTTLLPAEHQAQYVSSRFGSSTWRDELRSPTLFGATRHSRSNSLREELRHSQHEDAETRQLSHLQTQQFHPEVHSQNVHSPEEAQFHGQEAFEGQASPVFHQDYYAQQGGQDYDQDPYAQQQYDNHGHFSQQSYGQAQYSPDFEQAHHGQLSSLEAELQEADDYEDEDDQADHHPADDQTPQGHDAEEVEQNTPHLAPQTSEPTVDASPLVLQQESPATPARDAPSTPPQGTPSTPSRGLADSRHNPERPRTPPSQAVSEEDVDPSLFVPRDVTNVPWHARTDSVPYSLRSQSTIDSMSSSPIHSALHADKHEPVIRDSWPASVHNMTRPRNDSTLTDRSLDDPFRYDGAAKGLRGPSGSVGSSSDSPPRNTGASPGSLISRMRGIFEHGASKQEPASPVRSRPVSGVFHPVRRVKTGSSSSAGADADADEPPRKGGFLNEAEDDRDAEYDELDERPRRKYKKDASGLRVPISAAAAAAAAAAAVAEGMADGAGGPAEPSGESVCRLAWLFVEGWRQRLRKAGDTIERSRWEWEIDGTTSVCRHGRASSVTFELVMADARTRVPEELGARKKKHRKSVRWALDDVK